MHVGVFRIYSPYLTFENWLFVSYLISVFINYALIVHLTIDYEIEIPTDCVKFPFLCLCIFNVTFSEY